jgi:HEPN domain-containing protein
MRRSEEEIHFESISEQDAKEAIKAAEKIETLVLDRIDFPAISKL